MTEMTEKELEYYEEAKENFLEENPGLMYENIYGQFGPRGGYLEHSYSCHARLNNDEPMSQIIISAIYSTAGDWPQEEQSLYFEYILDKETSPWRDIIDLLDLEVIRIDGCVAWIIVRNLDVNRYAMFHFLKGFRQILERGHAMKLFTDTIKGMSEEERKSFSVYKKFLISHFFAGKGSLMFSWGHDHMCIRGLPFQNLIDRKIVCDLHVDTFKKHKYYYSKDIGYVTFGGHHDNASFNAAIPFLKTMLTGGSTGGNIFNNPRSQANTAFAVHDVFQKFDEFIKSCEERYGEIKETVVEETKERAA